MSGNVLRPGRTGADESAETERLFLGTPQHGKIESSREVDDGQFRRLAAVNDRLHNPGRQESERQELAMVTFS
jgi:hypothetical protein